MSQSLYPTRFNERPVENGIGENGDLEQNRFTENSDIWSEALYKNNYATNDVFEANGLLKDASHQIRLDFVRKVYGILFAMFIVTISVAWPYAAGNVVWNRTHSYALIFAMLGLIAIMCIMVCVPAAMRTFPINYVLLLAFAISEGFLVGFTVMLFTWQSVFLACVLTLIVVLALTAYASCTKHDFSGTGPYLMISLLLLLLFGNTLVVLNMFGVEPHYLWLIFAFAGTVLFSFFIIYDTQRIIGGNHEMEFSIDDYAFAALTLYIDILNLFTDILAVSGRP